MKVYVCQDCRDTGVKTELHQQLVDWTVGTFCSCLSGEQRWDGICRIMAQNT